MVSDAFIVGEDFVSEHYFTTDAKESFGQRVKALRKEWDGQEHSRRMAFQAERQQLVRLFVRAADDSAARRDTFAALGRAFGYTSSIFDAKTVGPVTWIRQPGVDEAARLVVVEGATVDGIDDLLQKNEASLIEPYVREGEPDIESVPRLLSALFADDDAPEFVVVLAGRIALLTERERWPEGRYLAIDLQLIVDRADDRKGGETDRAVACLAVESLMPDAEGSTWWQNAFEESVKHTVGVSQDLREGVRLSIEIIANDVVERRAKQGLPPIPGHDAQKLATQSLRYLYRILFLLYAESSPELNVLPVGASEYQEGYGLDRLRELVLVELTEQSADRTHLYDSLATLFRLVDEGNAPSADDTVPEGLVFNSLKADLFEKRAIDLIAPSKVGDAALHRVLTHLLLSKEQKGRDRGYISYADLGINQLGAVYEGLMSYTGFFADEDLHEVAKDGDSSKGSWVVPVTRSGDIDMKHFVQVEDPLTGEKNPVIHRRGTFVYRLAGRERQQSASYYTPEVLTKFTVSQALEELLDQDGHTTTSEEILQLSVCEPALGSGAFAIEAVRQLADQYLTRRESELDHKVDPEARPRELQKVKAHIALHQVYGVDLNSTAVELAEISLWLDTMVEGLQAPWFGLRLKRGNSLIGARRAVFTQQQVADKTWLKGVPRDVPLTELAENMALDAYRVAGETAGSVHHFLLPALGWGSAVDAKEGKTFASDEVKKLKAWRKAITAKPTKKQVDQLVNLAYRVEALWQFALRRLEIAEAESARDIDLWGRDVEARRGAGVTRSEIEKKLGDVEGAFQRLRRVMDAWTAMWFWPLTDTLTGGIEPPQNLQEWIDGLTAILGTHAESTRTSALIRGRVRTVSSTAEQLGIPDGWHDLGNVEENNLVMNGAKPIAEVLESHPWLRAAEVIAKDNGFFHWPLDFAPVFARGGFDLQVGNPPWYRPSMKEAAALAEFDPWWQLAPETRSSKARARRENLVQRLEVRNALIAESVSIASAIAFLGALDAYPELSDARADLFMNFMVLVWRNSGRGGVQGLIHLETHFNDDSALDLRRAAYRRLRRHWEFMNERRLFEIQHQKHFSVNIYAGERDSPRFMNCSGVVIPSVIERSLSHDGFGLPPGIKDPSTGTWDVRPHSSRIQLVDTRVLKQWREMSVDPSRPWSEAPMQYAVNSDVASVLYKIATGSRLLELETAPTHAEGDWMDRDAVLRRYGRPSSWSSAWLQGSHQYVLNPLFKEPNPTLNSSTDWSDIDLTNVPADFVPATGFQGATGELTEVARSSMWPDSTESASDYRISWRKMLDNSGRRTLIVSIMPPGAVAGKSLSTARTGRGIRWDVRVVGSMGTLLSDLVVRAAQKSNLSPSMIKSLPLFAIDQLSADFDLRVARLLAVQSAYSRLWQEVWREEFSSASWAVNCESLPELSVASRKWTVETPLRAAKHREVALIELDALMALSLGVTEDELVSVASSQFPVLMDVSEGGRREELFDADGRKVPPAIARSWGESGISNEGSAPGVLSFCGYTVPFAALDRIALMREAYRGFAAQAGSIAREGGR